jgi:hypothetical protein
MLAFGVLYAILAGYFTGLLFAAKGIRRDEFRCVQAAAGLCWPSVFKCRFAPVALLLCKCTAASWTNIPNMCSLLLFALSSSL